MPDLDSDRTAAESPSAAACRSFTPVRDEHLPRGLTALTAFTDLYGARVRVQESSLATLPAVWIFVDPADDSREPTPTPSGIVHPAQRPAAAHLCRAMAKEMRDALDRWLAWWPVDPDGECERAAPPPAPPPAPPG
jgi:hypothetical protein